MTFQRLAETYFAQYLENHIIMVHNDITNTTSPYISFCYIFICIVNVWCKDNLEILFSETSKPLNP